MIGVHVKVWIAALGLATALTAALVAQAMAQYPPVRGNVVLTAERGILAVGGRTTINATVVDEAGNAVSGLSCTFAVARQPGSDASVDHGPFTTDVSGQVSTTLDVGSSVGTIVVEANCGQLSTAVSVVASGAEAPAAPPASLPGTGAGGGSGAGLGAWALIGAAAVAGVSSAFFVWRRRKA